MDCTTLRSKASLRLSHAMALAVAASWGSTLVHNLYELLIGVLAIENTGLLVVSSLLLVGYLMAPTSVIVLALVAAWAILNLAMGGMVTVLPLPIVPFEPEQSLSHYLVHFVYSLGQLPLLAISIVAVQACPQKQSGGLESRFEAVQWLRPPLAGRIGKYG